MQTIFIATNSTNHTGKLSEVFGDTGFPRTITRLERLFYSRRCFCSALLHQQTVMIDWLPAVPHCFLLAASSAAAAAVTIIRPSCRRSCSCSAQHRDDRSIPLAAATGRARLFAGRLRRRAELPAGADRSRRSRRRADARRARRHSADVLLGDRVQPAEVDRPVGGAAGFVAIVQCSFMVWDWLPHGPGLRLVEAREHLRQAP